MFKTPLRPLGFEKVPLYYPSLDEVAKVLDAGFKKNFSDASVQVVDCPDLTKAPFHLAAAGLCGNPTVSDVGGVPYLIPTVNGEKRYALRDVAELAGLPKGFVVGAGAGPAHVLGTNSEMMVNVKFGEKEAEDQVQSRICRIDPNPKPEQTKRYQVDKIDTAESCCLVNLFLSEGAPGQVLEVKASTRTGKENFMSCMSKALKEEYGDKPVAVGGTFCMEEGKCNMHVMPNFSESPITTEDQMKNWLQFFEMSGPITCLGYVISADPNLDLRMEHFHGFSMHGDGGHYHFDTTPEQVKYTAYLNVAQNMVRVDRPTKTHLIGRD